MSLSAFAYLYSELVQYHQNRVDSISELERRLESSGYGVGLKVLELITYRNREVRTCVNVGPVLSVCGVWGVCVRTNTRTKRISMSTFPPCALPSSHS